MRLILWKLLSCSSCCVCFQTLSARLMYDDWLAGLTLHAAMLFSFAHITVAVCVG